MGFGWIVDRGSNKEQTPIYVVFIFCAHKHVTFRMSLSLKLRPSSTPFLFHTQSHQSSSITDTLTAGAPLYPLYGTA